MAISEGMQPQGGMKAPVIIDEGYLARSKYPSESLFDLKRDRPPSQVSRSIRRREKNGLTHLISALEAPISNSNTPSSATHAPTSVS